MIFNKEKRLCFFTPTKNGTHTLHKFLRTMGWYTINPFNHAYPEVLIKKFPNLVNYKTFAFLRNPLERFESFVLFFKQKRQEELQWVFDEIGITKSIQDFSYEDMIDLIGKLPNRFDVFYAPQSKWMTFQTTEILDFDNFESELRRIAGVTDMPVPRENATTDWGKSVITDKVRAFVREYYAADYALAQERLGKDW